MRQSGAGTEGATAAVISGKFWAALKTEVYGSPGMGNWKEVLVGLLISL